MSCFSLKPAETPQLEGDKDELNEYFTSQINREMKGIIYKQLSLTFPQKIRMTLFQKIPMITCFIFSSVLFSLHLQNLTEVEEIERLLLENDMDMILRDELVALEFDEET